MQLPEDVRLFRDLSLLHDTVLSARQRETIKATIPAETFELHEKYVQGLLGDTYKCPIIAKNRAVLRLFPWMTA